MSFLRLITSSNQKRRMEEGECLPLARPAKVVAKDNQDESCYTAIESDTEPSLPVRMDWRTDPNKNLSDWTIEVSFKNFEGVEASQYYHVHKSVLVLESEYFQSFFCKNRTNSHGLSQLRFHEKAARLFPMFLDFMYGQDLEISSYDATIFHYFGHFFGMRRLRWEAKQFWQQDMKAETVATYYENAILFGDPKVMSALQEACCKDNIFLSFAKKSLIFQIPDPQLWLYVVEHVGPSRSEHLSKLVTWFCQLHKVDADTFLKLTSAQHMPRIDHSAASILLYLEQTYHRKGQASNDSLTSLQIRCIKSMEQNWKDIQVDNEENITLFSHQSPLFLAELLKSILSVAQSEVNGTETFERFAAAKETKSLEKTKSSEGDEGIGHMLQTDDREYHGNDSTTETCANQSSPSDCERDDFKEDEQEMEED